MQFSQRDKVVYRKKLAGLDQALAVTNQELEEVVEGTKKAQQDQIKSRVFLDGLIQNIQYEKQQREKSLLVFKHAIQSRQDQQHGRYVPLTPAVL